MGNDEHSQNVYRKARESGLDPLAYCDRMEGEFRQVWDRLHLSYDDFIRTTQPRHRAAVQKMVQQSFDAGDIYEGHYEGWYCVSCEAFKQEKDLGRRPLPDPSIEARLDQGAELLLPAVEVPRRAGPSLRGAPGLRRAGVPPERDAPPARRRARGHLGQPRRAVVGHSAAVRAVERRVRLVRRAHQLHRRRGLRHRRRTLRARGGRLACTWSARTSRASTAWSGRRCCSRPDCRCRRRCSATGGC